MMMTTKMVTVMANLKLFPEINLEVASMDPESAYTGFVDPEECNGQTSWKFICKAFPDEHFHFEDEDFWEKFEEYVNFQPSAEGADTPRVSASGWTLRGEQLVIQFERIYFWNDLDWIQTERKFANVFVSPEDLDEFVNRAKEYCY